MHQALSQPSVSFRILTLSRIGQTFSLCRTSQTSTIHFFY
ncbi:hypothetical protein NEICINOT_04549 [Neisseria cinerea ATCC 14685]|uniref:Uncharacterized protein n=1 Tax=Neisseria cinerea ATCC 14685 TaxID=546262 RepID=D0W4F2_NEICI|nr:hypothetical protein NEICINOT_04549 [Neisseria cinerea ATCC 14685]